MPNTKSKIPDDIYVGFIRSLFQDANILLLGVACHCLMAMLVYRNSGEPIYLLLAAGMLAAGLYRYYGIRKGEQVDQIRSKEAAEAWERYYLFGGTIQGVVAGFFCFTAIYLVPDPFGEVAAVGVIMGSATTIVGRNYGSKRMVEVLSVCVVLPICVAMMLKGDVNYFVLALFIVPFMVVITKMAGNVRTVLFAAITEEKKAKHLAQRFDKALNTMSHGLVMLGADSRVVVANAQAARVMGFARPQQLAGRTLKALLMRAVAGGMMSLKDSRFAEVQLTRALLDGRDRKLLLRMADGRHFEFSAREGHGELGVITFEEVTDRVEAEARIRHMARYDSLTGLPNRAYFHEVVAERLASGSRDRQCAVVIFDLDDFKSINDTLGHTVGDGLIYAVTERLANFAGEDIIVGRFGGDEFIIYFDRLDGREGLDLALDEIFNSLQSDAEVAGHSLRIHASAGAVISRCGESDIDGMVVKADLALFKAKEAGKGGWRVFEAAMDQAFRNRQVMKADLRTAVENRSLRVVYQPIVSMKTMRIDSCEALCRWDHPELGPISPAVFIPLAEEMGIVSGISTLVLEAACTECTKWPENISVSVNLSARDFRSAEIVSKVRRALDKAGLAPERLEVEVTETALLDDRASTRAYIEQLKAMGVRIALDDFGTGYSSLSYLHTLPLDKIKIDRSFLVDMTRNERSLELLKGIVNLSRPLGLAVTVEGVETFEQLKTLAVHVHPDLLQGFLFGSALTASGIETMSNMVWPFAQELRAAKATTPA